MKRGVALAVFGIFIGLAGAPMVRANITPYNYPNPLSPYASVTGVVTNIDPVNRLLQVRESSGMLETIRVDERIEILLRGQVVKLDDLRFGDSVTVVSK